MLPPAVGQQQRDALGRVDRRSAAHGGKAIGLDVGGQVRPGQAVDVPGIRLHLREDHHLQPGGDEVVADRTGEPGGLHTGVGDQQHPVHAETGRARPGLAGHAAAEQHARGQVELAVGGHALAAPDGRRVRRLLRTVQGFGGGRARRHQDVLPSSVTMSKITVAAAREVISAWS